MISVSIFATHMLVYLSIEARVILKYKSDVPSTLKTHSDSYYTESQAQFVLLPT